MSAQQDRSGGDSRQQGLENKALGPGEDKAAVGGQVDEEVLSVGTSDGSIKQFSPGEVADGTDGVPAKPGGVDVVISHFIDDYKPGQRVTLPAIQANQLVDGHYARFPKD